MRSTQLRAFHAVAREGSFSGAAARAGLTQPAITIQVRNLEKDYGLKLFERTADGVNLSAAGETLFQMTRELFGIEDRIAGFLDASRALETGELHLSADGPHLATKLIAAFRKNYPGIRITLALGNAAEVWQDLTDGRADAVIAANPPAGTNHHLVALQESPLMALVAAGHAWGKLKRVPVGRLTGQAAVVRERLSNTRRTVDRMLRRHRVVLGDVLELGSREAVNEAVAADLGVGFIFASETVPDPRLRALVLDDANVVNREVAACLKPQGANRPVAAFMELAAAWNRSGA